MIQSNLSRVKELLKEGQQMPRQWGTYTLWQDNIDSKRDGDGGGDPRMKVDTRFWGWPQQHSTSSPSSLWAAFFYIRNVLLLYSLSVDISPPLSLFIFIYMYYKYKRVDVLESSLFRVGRSILFWPAVGWWLLGEWRLKEPLRLGACSQRLWQSHYHATLSFSSQADGLGYNSEL